MILIKCFRFKICTVCDQVVKFLTGPPDAPLDVQVELGPKPGVLLITWLPVTIDAAGTSNGVRVTGYAVYADGQKVSTPVWNGHVYAPNKGSVHICTLEVYIEYPQRIPLTYATA